MSTKLEDITKKSEIKNLSDLNPNLLVDGSDYQKLYKKSKELRTKFLKTLTEGNLKP